MNHALLAGLLTLGAIALLVWLPLYLTAAFQTFRRVK